MSKIIESPDKELVAAVREGLKKTGGYCPCAIEHINDTKCMCKDFRDQTEGPCHCGLYIKTNE